MAETERVLSEKTLAIITGLQQNEVTERHIYLNLAKRVKKESDKATLRRIAGEEAKHAEIWRRYTKKQLKPEWLKVWFYTIISFVLGYTFAIKIMEKGEKVAQSNYADLVEEVPEAEMILKEEAEHEEALISMLDEDRLQYVGSMVLGLNDALVELTGTLAGLSFALQNNRIVALSGLITGISATLSMASSEYLSARSEGNTDAVKSALYTGIMYIFAVVCLVLPYLLYPAGQFLGALLTMLLVVIAIIFAFTYYISVAKDLPFKKRFLEMAGISLSVAVLSFLVGFLVKHLLGIDV
ncbi:MAG: VIT1/CCC1 transporter family protein [Limnochordia bacterium]|nr:VIT1/CCC1 transporter family protein [Bacillota bacterium]NLH31684.1 rubrerythrin family protein [Bacillota bacterium]HPT94019.1 VIT1/CCC1 transporter family protein [Limnochordia bacterium]HPZ30804.1 VIT1/CCC1 transporter family protein [Limnochordia bacterium]HXK96582.1 VIT1/CCC1 transporter family protein [Limnochordia bacterium]